MQYKKLGRTGLMVSEICLGTMTFGQQVGETEAINLMKNAMAAGVNFIDTADQYINGRAEEIVGKALKEERHAVVLATKVGAWQSGPGVNDIGLSRKHIMKAIEGSLRRLGTDYIDLYFAHRPDYNTPIDETLRALDDLVHQGKVRYIACSNFRAWQLCEALWVSDLRNLARFDCIQSPYNLITRDIEYELLPLCIDKGVGVTVYNPLAGGLLTGKYDPNKPPSEGRFTVERLGPMYSERYWSAPNFEAVAQLKKIAREHGRNLPQFALAWILNNKAITSIVLGTSSIKQLEENLGATDIKLSEEESTACDNVWQQLRPIRFSYGR
ncbi:1-deoxyxylulose-5-phosphate synthase YajO [subsurface metagenome]